MKKFSTFTLIMALLVPLLIGGISAALSSRGMELYANMEKPPLSPPAWVFSVAWTILYLLMGLASYYILISETDNRSKAMSLIIYGLQLIMNFMWSIVFFNMEAYLAAFVWLIIMWIIVIICAFRFFAINRVAAYLMIPYILWLTFAAYLNMGAYILNSK